MRLSNSLTPLPFVSRDFNVLSRQVYEKDTEQLAFA